MKCELCDNATSNTSVCSACQRRMAEGEHPVICIQCRINLGSAYSVEWIKREFLDKETREAVSAMHSSAAQGIASFVRHNCPDCRDMMVPVTLTTTKQGEV